MRGRRVAGVLLGLVAAAAAGIPATLSGCQSFGAHAGGERLARMERSPEWRDGEFAGQYDAAWPDWHLGPEQAVSPAGRVRAKALTPVHWGLFRLAPHGWTEPVERVLAAARCAGLPVITPPPGQAIEPTALRPGGSSRWWPDAHWSDAVRTPIVATVDGVDAHRVALPACPAAATAQAASER